MAALRICSPEFRARSYCQATESQLRGFGGFVRKNLLGYMSMLDVLVRHQDCLFVPDTFQKQTIISEAQDVVTEFLSRNSLTAFDTVREVVRGRPHRQISSRIFFGAL
jgi:hypothetical protein